MNVLKSLTDITYNYHWAFKPILLSLFFRELKAGSFIDVIPHAICDQASDTHAALTTTTTNWSVPHCRRFHFKTF